MTVAPERWEAVVDIIVSPRGQASFLPTKDLLDDIAWRATDTGRVWGAGLLVEGTAEALAMTMSGRTAYLDQLNGDGVPLLRDRLAAG